MKMLCQVQLSKHRYKTPEGYLICYDCILARTGKQTYLQSELYGITEGEDRYIDVDRKADQVFNEKTMASFEGKPLTIEHPDVSVSPENYKELSVGNVHNIHRGTFDGNDVMYGDITVYDAEAIALIESGEMTELSCGYDCDITDGPNPEQINIRGNHIALCEQGRAGIARIQDSKKKPWGAAPIIRDSVQRGTLIQEFGAYGKQYKVSKIQGNVLYCEELQSGKTFLFKKDKENVDWAIIKKTDVKDSEPNVDLLRSKTKHWTLDLDHDTLCVTLFGLDNRSSAALDHKFKDKVYDTFEEALADAEKLFAEYKDQKEITDTRYGYYSVNIIEWQEGAGNCVDTNDKNIGSMPAFSAFDKDEIKGLLRDAMKQQGYIRDSEEPVRYMVYHFSGANQKHTTDADGLTIEEAENIFRHCVSHFSEFNKNHEHTSYFEVFLDEESDFYGGDHIRYAEIDEEGNAKIHGGTKDTFTLPCEPFAGDFKGYQYHYDRRHPKDVWILKNAQLVKKLDIKELLEKGNAEEAVKKVIDGMDAYDYWEKTHPSGATTFYEDSFVPLYIIALDKNTWLDDNDRPTEDVAKARQFRTREDADEYRKVYCKGSVEEVAGLIKDSLDTSSEVEEIKELLKENEYTRMIADPELNVIDIWFKDRRAMKEAARKLVKRYSIDLDPVGEEACITIYDKINRDIDAIDLTKDSAPYFGRSKKIYDEYSKRFYTRAIRELEAKLEKLKKNELLDANQEDYEEQKTSLINEIEKQIKDYTEKLNAE